MFEKSIDGETVLKLLERHHAEELFHLVESNREHLRPWFPWVDTTREPADSEAFINDALQGFANGTCIHFGIWHRGKLVGVVAPHTIRESNRSGEIGYWVGKDAEGQGIITRSCAAIIDYLVEVRKLNRIEARCVVSNQRSRQVMERLGMRHEGTLRQWEKIAQGYEDLLIYAVLASEWRKKRKED